MDPSESSVFFRHHLAKDAVAHYNIGIMDTNRWIALVVGAVVTVTVFVVMMWWLLYGGVFPDKDKLILASIALCPVLMAAFIVGYAVWWGVMFLLALVRPTGQYKEEDNNDRAHRR